jgi:hypothetical protein
MSGKSLAAIVIFSCAVLGITSEETGSSDGPQCTICEEGMPCFVNETAPCPPFSNNLRQSDNTSECVCHPGFFMADQTCTICPSGFYCPGFHDDAQNSYTDDSTTRRRLLSTGSGIVPCPANSSSVTGADSVTMCLCNIGYVAVNCSIPEVSVVVNNPPENMRWYESTCGNHQPGNPGAQSMLDSASYWVGDFRCGSAQVGTFMAIDLGKSYQIHGVVTQNSKNDPHLVTSIKVSYSDSKMSGFVSVDGGRTFQLPNALNWEQTVSTYSYFSQPVTARHIRIYPQTWISLMLMRAGVLTSEAQVGPPPTLNSSTCKPVCVACEPGTYKAVAGNVVACQDCPENTYSSSTSACAACPESTESPPGSAAATSCIPSCEPGYTGPAGSCTACDVGKYKNTSGSSPCTTCPAGHVSHDGESSCRACVPGKYAPNFGYNCLYCPTAKYSSVYAASSEVACQYCAAGQYSDYSTAEHGFDRCLQCPPNSSSNPGTELGHGDRVQAQCSCNAGYAVYPGYPWHPTEDLRLSPEQLCQPCAAGTYQPETVQWGEIRYLVDTSNPTCLPCPAHMTSEPGSAVCVCGAGSYGVPGGPACEPCGLNEFSAQGALTADDCRCSAGYFREQAESECVACPVNSFRVFGEQELACVPCASGSTTRHNASNSSAMCAVCPAGSFVAEGGDCRPCPEHASSLPGTVGSCQCDAGYASEGDSCVPCADGYYKGLPGNEECAACSTGKIGTAVQTRTFENVSCVVCPANKYWTMVSGDPRPNPYLSYDMNFYPPDFTITWGRYRQGGVKFFMSPARNYPAQFRLLFVEGAYTAGSSIALQLADFLQANYGIARNCVRRQNEFGRLEPDCKDKALALIFAQHLPMCNEQMTVVPCQIIQTTRPVSGSDPWSIDFLTPTSGANAKYHVFAFRWFLEIDSVCSVQTQQCTPQPVTRQWKWFSCQPQLCGGQLAFFLPTCMECGVFDGTYANIAVQDLGVGDILGVKKIYARDASLDPVAATAACVNCTRNSQSAAGSVNATNCQCNAGYFAASGSCQACAPGTFKDTVSSDVACSPCGGSTYTPFSAATECLSCPGNSTGHALSNDAELDCKCDPGFNGSDGGPCAACEPGKFKTEPGDHGCVDCGAYAFWPSHAVPTENRCQSCPEHSTRAPDAHGLNILDCHCEAGYWRANESTCLQCPMDFYCPGYLLACPLHSVSAAGSALIDHCRCEAGFFGDAGSCAACPANAFCPEDALSPLACPSDSSTLGLISATSVSNCTCHAGFHRDETSGVRCRPCGEIAPCEGWETVTCPPNSTAPLIARELSECVCDPGFRLPYSSDGNVTCTLCSEQEVCREGLSTQCAAGAVNINMRCVCAPGSHCPGSGSSCTAGDSRSCFACPLNHWCYNNTRTACRANEEAPVNSTSRSACRCVDGYFRDALGACAVCPLHHVCKNETRRPVTLYDEHLRTLYTGAIDLSEAVCAAGMFRTSMTDLCKTCPRNFFCPQTGVALPNVVRCPENQFTYEPGASSRGDCVCLAGFRLLGNNEDARCLPCALGERCQDGEVVEELCHLQNKVASADHESCVCQEGYGLVNFDCQVCAPGFVKPSSGDTPCLPCASGTYAINTTTCVPCPEHSDSRPGSSACRCAPPYEWTSNATCRLCPTDHFWQDQACYACPALSSSQPTPVMALGSAACRCAIGHVAAPLNVSGSLECSPCANGTYETGGECRQCGHGAWSFAASSTHTACVCNRLPNSSVTCHNQLVDGSCAGECASPPAACTQCEPGHHKPAYSTPGNSESCLACSDGHFQPDFGALACIRCPQNEWHESLGQVSRMSCLCVQGFARPANASEAAANASESEPTGKSPCQACSPGRYKDWLGDQQCLPCDVGRYSPDFQSTFCHFCSDATADYEAWLLAIAPDLLAWRADNFSRMVLESNTTVREAAVSVLECVCDIGQEPRTVGDFSVCSRCRQGSFQEHKLHDDCTYCGGTSVEHGHSLLHHYGLPGAGVTESSHCGACPPFSGHNETLVGPGKVIVSDISKCLCFPGHERIFSENSSECQNCSQYMMQPFVSDDACEFCPAGHYFIDRHVVCELCSLPEDGGERHVGLVLNKHDHTLPWGTSEDDCVCRVGFERDFHSQCTACTAGKFRGSNITRHCALCPADTFQDLTAQQACITCPLYSSTLSLEGGDSPSDCVCGPGFQPLFLIDSSTGVCHACLAGTFRTSRLLNESDAPCFTCPENYYCPLGAQVPVPCPFGELSLAGSGSLSDCQCPPGYGRNTHPVQVAGNESAGEELTHQNTTLRAACTVCARGFFSENMSNSLCPRCPENKTTSFSGATNQSDCKCVPGHGVDTQIPSAACHLCADGSFSAGGDNEPCRSCGWGTQTKPFYMPESDESCVCNAHLGVFTKR